MSCASVRCTSFFAVFGLFLASGGALAQQNAPAPARYATLLTLFREWREFQRPKWVNRVPDYSAAAMAAQARGLASFQRRLAAIDTTGWTAAQQVDREIVRAEMNGLDFDHRVLRPWARNPAFYVSIFPGQSDQPAREGHFADGSLELWSYPFPLSDTDAAAVRAKLEVIPGLLAQAERNLVGNAKDLWTMGIRTMGNQASDLQELAGKVGEHAELAAAVGRARRATDDFRAWLERQAPSKTGPSGIGIENCDWYLKNVQLLPYTWQDEVTLMRRELGRSRAALALEELRNHGLPAQDTIASDDEWRRRFNAAVTEYLGFLRSHGVLTMRDYMDPALRSVMGRFTPGPREFFSEVNYRDPIVMLTHDFHWIDLARMKYDPHPSEIRRGPLLYNIFNTRTEGFATAMEEMMTEAGLVDSHPRSRELVYILVAERAARALGDLMMHANRVTLGESVKWVSAQTPRGYLREDGGTVWGEQHLYLQQPTYGTSYLVGKAEIERLLADRAQQLGRGFTLQRFMDDFTAVGLIPISLVRWDMTGQPEGARALRPQRPR